jgi:hypothetical protein
MYVKMTDFKVLYSMADAKIQPETLDQPFIFE